MYYNSDVRFSLPRVEYITEGWNKDGASGTTTFTYPSVDQSDGEELIWGIRITPLTPGAAYIRVFAFYWHIKYHILNMLKIKCDIN